MRGNPPACITGVRLEPVYSLRLNVSLGYEVLSLLAPDINTEHFFRTITAEYAAGIFLRQTRFIRSLSVSGFFTFNLPAVALVSERLLTSVFTGLIPGMIIEIQDPHSVTGMTVSEIKRLRQNISDIRAGGGYIWLDDMTPGLADFFLKLKLPVDGVKTDRSVLHHTQNNDAELKGIVEICQQLAPLVVAEGIETTEMKKRVQAAGVQAGQGFLWPGKVFLYPQ